MADEPSEKNQQDERDKQPELLIRDAARQQFASKKAEQVHDAMKNLSPELKAEIAQTIATGQKDNVTPLPTPKVSKPDNDGSPYRAREPGERKTPELPPPSKRTP